LKILREKAHDRNPDEFHFAMMSSRTVDGVKIGDRGNKALSHEVVMLLKTQDAGYLRTALQKTRMERRKLENSILLENKSEGPQVKLLGRDASQGSRKVFVESVEDQKVYKRGWRRQEDTDDADDDSSVDEHENDGDENNEQSNSRATQLKMLQALQKREQELLTATRELELQRAKMSNTVGGVNKDGVKFKIRERKR
jgi:U3 small nucleolar RNA-associated protein 11